MSTIDGRVYIVKISGVKIPKRKTKYWKYIISRVIENGIMKISGNFLFEVKGELLQFYLV